jgi:hypothetical protein
MAWLADYFSRRVSMYLWMTQSLNRAVKASNLDRVMWPPHHAVKPLLLLAALACASATGICTLPLALNGACEGTSIPWNILEWRFVKLVTPFTFVRV